MSRISATMLALALMCLAPLAASAADPGFCRDYANAALYQSRLGYSVPYCAQGMRGARWSQDFGTHFNWCLGVPYGAAQNEREIRRQYLVSCRGG